MSDGNAKKARSKFTQAIAMISVTNYVTQLEQDWSPTLHCYKCEAELRLGLMTDAYDSLAMAKKCFRYNNAKAPYVIAYVYYLNGMICRLKGKNERALKMMDKARRRYAKKKLKSSLFSQTRNHLHLAGLHYDLGNLEQALKIWSRFLALIFKHSTDREERIMLIHTSLENIFMFKRDAKLFLQNGSVIAKKASRTFSQDFAVYQNSKYNSRFFSRKLLGEI